jgi:TolB-like protein/Flp pilus assembly protein TadD
MVSERLARLNRTLGELRRRHVYRLAGVYAIGGWLILQVADILLDLIGAPDGSLRVVAMILVLGFPLALVMAWVYDITPEGVVRTNAAAAEDVEPIHWNWRWLDYAIIVALLAILTYVLVRGQEPASARLEHSIAVLPFADLSPNGDHRYFSDGISEALMDSLARVQGLQVASRTSSFAMRSPERGAREVASALEVGTVLEGSVRKSGQRLRISVRLVDGRSGRNLWTETFDASMDDIFSVQDTISRRVAEVFEIRLLGAGPLVEVATRDQTAYEEYLRGREQLRRGGTVGEMDQALAFFRSALELDEHFTLAMAGLCTAYWKKYEVTRDSGLAEQAITACQEVEARQDSSPEAFIALGGLYRTTGKLDESLALYERALSLAPNNAEVYAGLGETSRTAGDLEAAERHLRRAIELDPAYWRHHWDLGRTLVDDGRQQEAIDQINRAIRLQPDSPAPYYSLGGIYYLQGEYLKAADAFRQSIERYPTAPAYSNAGTLYFDAGDYVQAEEIFRQAIVTSPQDYRFHAYLAESIGMQPGRNRTEAAEHFETAIRLAYEQLEINPSDHLVRADVAAYLAQVGRVEDAQAELSHLERIESPDMFTNQAMAMAYLFIGQHDAAVRHFSAAVAGGYPLASFQRDPRLAVLAEHPEFQALVRGAALQQ